MPTALKSAVGRMTASRPAQRAQRILVAVQLALALTLLIASAAMAQSFWRLKGAELGFDPAGLLAMEVELPTRPYPDYHRNAAFFERLLEHIRAIPGVTAAEGTLGAPLAGMPAFQIEAVTAEAWATGTPKVQPPVVLTGATPGYFTAMRIPLVRGRSFQRGDVANDDRPVIISAELARTLFASQDPIGRRLRLLGRRRDSWYTVVGVAGNVPGESVARGPWRVAYFPMTNDLTADSADVYSLPVWPRAMTLVVRTSLPPASVVGGVRRAIRELDPKVPVARVRTMEEVVASSMARARLTMLLLLTAAGCALALGVIGVYAVVSYAVSRRMPEFGVRIALGARPADVHRLVLGEGAIVTLAAVAVGIAAAWSLLGLLRGLLFEVSPRDPLSFAAMSLLLFVVAALANYLPARRAARVDPVEALRAE